jgi:hypothetical protein
MFLANNQRKPVEAPIKAFNKMIFFDQLWVSALQFSGKFFFQPSFSRNLLADVHRSIEMKPTRNQRK